MNSYQRRRNSERWRSSFYWVHCDLCPWKFGSTNAHDAIREKERHEQDNCPSFGLAPVPWHRTQGMKA